MSEEHIPFNGVEGFESGHQTPSIEKMGAVVAKVDKLMDLPSEESPMLATVSDVETDIRSMKPFAAKTSQVRTFYFPF